MLQTQTVDGSTLGLLKDLMAIPELEQFALVGGTNLSLRLGHRLSIDLDLFTNKAFDTEGIARILTARFPSTIMAMKMSAIARRGVKKDFWDVAELLDMYSLAEMIEFYKAKYASHDILHLVRALAYFADAEKQKDPDPLKKMTWKQVKVKMQITVKKYLERNRI